MHCQVHIQFIPKQASFAHSTNYVRTVVEHYIRTITVHVRMCVRMYVIHTYVHTYVCSVTMAVRSMFAVYCLCRSLSQVRSERQGGTLSAGEDGESSSEQFNEVFDSQGGGESDNVCVADWDEDEETKGEGEEEEEKVKEEKEKEGKEVGTVKETGEENEYVIGEAGMQMISNGLNIIPGVESAKSVTTSQTVLRAPAHSDGESPCGVPLLDSPAHSSSSLSEGGKHSLTSRSSSGRFLTPAQEGTPSNAELSGTKKSPMARYQAMAAIILGSASDKSSVNETKQTGTLDQVPQSSGLMESGEGITEKVDEVQRCSKKKKAKKAVKIAARFGNPQPQISSTGPLPVLGLPLPVSLNSDAAPKESMDKEPSPSSTISSQESGMLPTTKPHASSSPPDGYTQTTEAGTVGCASDDNEGGAVGSTGNDREGGVVGSTGNDREGGVVGSTGNDREGGVVGSTGNDREGGVVGSTGNDREGGVVGSTGNDREGGVVGSTGNDREGGVVGSTGNDREGGVVGSTGNDREGGVVGSTGDDTEGEANRGSSKKQLAKWQDQLTALKVHTYIIHRSLVRHVCLSVVSSMWLLCRSFMQHDYWCGALMLCYVHCMALVLPVCLCVLGQLE